RVAEAERHVRVCWAVWEVALEGTGLGAGVAGHRVGAADERPARAAVRGAGIGVVARVVDGEVVALALTLVRAGRCAREGDARRHVRDRDGLSGGIAGVAVRVARLYGDGRAGRPVREVAVEAARAVGVGGVALAAVGAAAGGDRGDRVLAGIADRV